MRLLDLFCGAGGASMGYHLAGFEVVGVDIEPQPRYPFTFHQADAMTFPLRGFDAIHASPPCQAYCRMNRGFLQALGTAGTYPDLIAQTRRRLKSVSVPYVIENVEGAPLLKPIMLCGSSFGLQVQRHRYFELSFYMLTPECCHANFTRDKPPLHRSHGPRSSVVGCYGGSRGNGDTLDVRRKAMGIDWMSWAELNQAIPPAYTLFIGRQLMRLCKGKK